MDSPLAARLLDHVRKHGPLPFIDAMRLALYDPVDGYYTSPNLPIGRSADFVTAPEHHPAFGLLVGRRIAAIYSELGSPSNFTVIEMGAGTGALARGVLRACDAAGLPVRYRIVEPLAVWRKRQEDTLKPWRDRVDWVDDLEALPPLTGVFLSNELLDAFPVRRLLLSRDGSLVEVAVDSAGERLVEVCTPVSESDAAVVCARIPMLPPVGVEFAFIPDLPAWLAAVRRGVRRGAVLTIDYGATEDRLFSRAPGRAAIRAYYRQHAVPDLLASPGRHDLTADVNFSDLLRLAEGLGMAAHAFTSQRQFLMAMGWRTLLHAPDTVDRRALTDLVDPDAMGATLVLELGLPEETGGPD